MKKPILHTLGLAAMAALLCVFCGDNTTDGTAGGEVDALLSKFYNNETPGSGGGGGDGTSLVLGNGQAWTSGNSGFIFTSNNRFFEIYKLEDSWYYADTGIYQTNGDIITINSVAGTYRVSDDVLLLSSYTYTFAKTSGISPKAVGEGFFIDGRDSKIYRKIKINNQTWMAENLNFAAVGSICRNNIADNCAKYGRLYNWSTMMDGRPASPSGVQGVCPAGWHIPSNAEWTTLVNAVGGQSTAGTKLKSAEGWNYDGNGTDDYGWSALPGGAFCPGSCETGSVGYWGSVTEADANNAIVWRIEASTSSRDVMSSYYCNKTSWMWSVRCVKNE